MAARRVSKSAVDWAAFAERVPVNQRDFYRSFKAKSESYLNRIHQYPESLPKIDFAFYKSRLGNAAMVDQFEKSYKSFEIKYPLDKSNVVKAISEEQKQAESKIKNFVAELHQSIADSKALLQRLDQLPAPEQMTRQMYAYYFPESALNPASNPTFWPHTPITQPGHKDAGLM